MVVVVCCMYHGLERIAEGQVMCVRAGGDLEGGGRGAFISLFRA